MTNGMRLAAVLAAGCALTGAAVAENAAAQNLVAQARPDTVNAHMSAAAKAAGFDHIGIYNRCAATQAMAATWPLSNTTCRSDQRTAASRQAKSACVWPRLRSA
jgi:hypothetical protein